MQKISKIGLILNYNKRQPIQLGKEVIEWLKYHNIQVLSPKEDASYLDFKIGVEKEEFCSKVDIVLVLGGDGTFLRAARYIAGYKIPILGVNLGYLGFLTEIEVGEIYFYLEKMLNGDFYIEERMMLSGQVKRNNKWIGKFNALNDFVINKGSFARLITLDTFLGDEFVASYSADGIIISTPTGSTAYSLSAGGPIVHPVLDVCIITPICPHSLYARPIVIPPEKIVKVLIRAVKAEAMLTVDGQYGFKLENQDEVWIEKADYVTRLIRVKGRKFFQVMREKLKSDGGSNYE
ncbi:MAG: kinase [Clostridia bacterium]|jgi:NAD+ kinase|nr:kinase [Clostridia bacterium]MDN5323067.1 kinase [Clostridia bacterium]